MLYYQCNLIRVDVKRNVKVAIKDTKFLISSLKMSTLLSKFRELFNPLGKAVPTEIQLLKDLETFYVMCQLAHSVFIPQGTITTDNLVKLAAKVQKYNIPKLLLLYAVVNFYFII